MIQYISLSRISSLIRISLKSRKKKIYNSIVVLIWCIILNSRYIYIYYKSLNNIKVVKNKSIHWLLTTNNEKYSKIDKFYLLINFGLVKSDQFIFFQLVFLLISIIIITIIWLSLPIYKFYQKKIPYFDLSCINT